MRTLISLLLAATPVVATAQIAATAAWAVNGKVYINEAFPEVYDRTQFIEHEASFAAYDQSNVMNNWNSAPLSFEYSETSIGFSGPVNPVDVHTGLSLRNWVLRVESQQHELLVLSLPYLGMYGNVKGNCPNALSSFTGLDVHDASLTINGQNVPIPAQPEENTFIPLDLSNDLGNSSGQLALRATERNDSNSNITITGLNLQVAIAQGETTAVVNLQIGYGHANLDCLHVPVELQTWFVE